MLRFRARPKPQKLKVDAIVRRLISSYKTARTMRGREQPVEQPAAPAATTTKADARKGIAIAQSLVSEARAKGADVSKAEQIFAQATVAFNEGRYEEARRIASEIAVVGVGLGDGELGIYQSSGAELKTIKAEGISIPESGRFMHISAPVEDVTEMMQTDIVYPLIPEAPKKDEPVFAYAEIKWNRKEGDLEYYVVEPKLYDDERDILKKLKDLMEERLDVDFTRLGRLEATEFLMQNTDNLLQLMGIKLSEERGRILKYYITRDFIGLERIEPLVKDPQIEDISCDGIGTSIYIYHRDPRLGSVRTNVRFESAEELDMFVMKLAQRCKKTISIAEPLLGGALADGSRVQATLGTDIARLGSNFTIRKFTESPLTPVDMMNFGTVDATILAYLWLVVEYGRSVLVSGGTATGKTSFLNVLSLFIKPSMRIVSIEDTPELKLPHPHWVPEVARTAIAEVEGRKVGEVDMFDLLKESLRQRPDYIIVGEVRGKEAYVLFQQMATGHAGLATIHADNLQKLVDRLTTPPISLPPGLVENLDVVVFLTRIKIREKYTRRANEIVEIIGFERGHPVVNEMFKWNPVSDKFDIAGSSATLKKIAQRSGIPESILQNEISRRVKLLEWMRERGIRDYRDVARVIAMYYSDPERAMSLAENM